VEARASVASRMRAGTASVEASRALEEDRGERVPGGAVRQRGCCERLAAPAYRRAAPPEAFCNPEEAPCSL